MSFRKHFPTRNWVQWLREVSQEQHMKADFQLHERIFEVSSTEDGLDYYSNKDLILAERFIAKDQQGKKLNLLRCVYAEPVSDLSEPELIDGFRPSVPYSIEIGSLKDELDDYEQDDYRNWVWRWKTCERDNFFDTVPN